MSHILLCILIFRLQHEIDQFLIGIKYYIIGFCTLTLCSGLFQFQQVSDFANISIFIETLNNIDRFSLTLECFKRKSNVVSAFGSMLWSNVGFIVILSGW